MLMYEKGFDQDHISYGWKDLAANDDWEAYAKAYSSVFKDLNIPQDEGSNVFSSLYQTQEFQTCGERRVSPALH